MRQAMCPFNGDHNSKSIRKVVTTNEDINPTVDNNHGRYKSYYLQAIHLLRNEYDF